jgi:uncharacterized protein with FMN-binding domain
MEPTRKLHPGITALIVIVLVGIVATAVIVININGASTKKADDTTTQTAQIPNDTNPSDAASSYKDGTYSATGSYSSPGGLQTIDLTVTIEKGIITSTSLVTKATDGDAKEYQADFARAYKGFVVGRNVDKVSLSRVAGSSLTSNGFNKALDQIKTDAKA